MFVAYATSIFCAIMHVIEPIFAAKVITCLTIGEYSQAFMWLSLGMIQILLRNTSWHINFKNYGKLTASMNYPLHNRIIDKVLNAKAVNFKENSVEKMINILGNDILTVTNFADCITQKTASLFRVLLTLIIVFTYNIPIGFVLIGISILNYFILEKLNTKITSHNKSISESKDKIFENFSDIVGGRDLTGDLDVTSEVKEKYLQKCEKYVQYKTEHKTWVSYRDNWFFVFWNFLVYGITCYLIYLLSSPTSSLDLTLYLIIVPYLASSIDRVNNFFNTFSDLKNANVSVSRLSTILNFTEKELIEFGNNTSNDIDGEIAFNDVSYEVQPTDDTGYTSLYNVSFHIPKDSITVFHGSKGCGKRMIFYMLRRIIKPTTGIALISNINIFDYDKSVYKENISYVTYAPYFFDDTIMNNLNIVEKNPEKILAVCKTLNIHDDILNLPEGYNSSLNKNLDKISPELQFLIGLARAILTKAEILMIYELPSSLSGNEKKHIMNTIKTLSEDRTFIIFSSRNDIESIANKVYEVKNGICKEKKLHRKNKT